MAVETTNTFDLYSGNESNSIPYPITFEYLDPAHIYIEIDGGSYTDFTVDSSGVTTNDPISSAMTLKILRVMPVTQPYEFSLNSKIAAERIEQAFDWVTMLIQQCKCEE